MFPTEQDWLKVSRLRNYGILVYSMTVLGISAHYTVCRRGGSYWLMTNEELGKNTFDLIKYFEKRGVSSLQGITLDSNGLIESVEVVDLT